MSTASCRCSGAKCGQSNPDHPKQPPCPCKKCKTKAEELKKREPRDPCKKPEDYGSEAVAGGQIPAKCVCVIAQANDWPETGQGVKSDNNDEYWPEPWNQGENDDYWPDNGQNVVYPEDMVDYLPDDGEQGWQADWPEYYPEEDAYQDRQTNNWPEYNDYDVYPESSQGMTANNEEYNDYWPDTGQQAYDDYNQDFGNDCRDYLHMPSNLMCECPGTKPRHLGLGPNATEYASKTDGVAFGQSEYARKSSVTEGTPYIDEIPRSACSISFVPSAFDQTMSGRDTLNLPIHLRGNQGLLNISGQMVCQDNYTCNEYCGVNTGCSPSCAKGGKASGQGIKLTGNENINAVVTFLLEMLGILVFFAICTFTFWITVCYYVIQLLIDLINADRNVHVAVGIMFTLLIIAYSISHLTYGAATCMHRNQNEIKAIRVGGGCSCHSSAGDGRSTRAALSSLKKSLASMMGKRKCSQGNVKAPATIRGKSSCQRNGKVSRQKYSDCQGRKIFQRSRRNAMLTEMKQPPTWILWLRETVNGLFGQS